MLVPSRLKMQAFASGYTEGHELNEGMNISLVQRNQSKNKALLLK